jgi:hypothetical protein
MLEGSHLKIGDIIVHKEYPEFTRPLYSGRAVVTAKTTNGRGVTVKYLNIPETEVFKLDRTRNDEIGFYINNSLVFYQLENESSYDIF